MARLVIAKWAPRPFTVGQHRLGSSWGVLGERHPDLPAYRWVDWLETGVSGYYDKRDIHEVGTAFIEPSPK